MIEGQTFDPEQEYAMDAAEDAWKRDYNARKNIPIEKGSVVCCKQHGWKRVTAVFKDTVNVAPVFGGRGRFSGIIKNVPKDEIFEDHDNWYENWTKSETYQCM